jgi:hypothetical protein
MNMSRSKFISLFIALTAMLVSAVSFGSDWIHTGTGIRVKTILVVDVNVYQISHFMQQLPATKSKRAVIDMETAKKFECKMLRDLDAEKLKTALKDAYAMNGYTDQSKIGTILNAFRGDLKEGQKFSIKYDNDKKETTFAVDGQGSITVGGVDFMKATWSIWFGKIDQPRLGDQLISKIP